MKNDDAPKVTVIMYVKNGDPYFRRSLGSVVEQTLRDIEVLVVDGGSTDGTLEAAQEMAQKDCRVRVLSCFRGSVGTQLNMGIMAARGDYIGIVESDDYILPQMYEREYDYAREMGFPDIVRADNYIFWGEGEKEVRVQTRISHDDSVYGCLLSAESNPQKVLIGGSFWTGIYRRGFLMNHGIFANESDGAAYQDFSFLFQASVLADTVCFMRDAFYCYRKDNPQSSCNSPIGIHLIGDEYAFLKEMMVKRGIWEKYSGYYYLWKIRNYRWFYRNLGVAEKKAVIPLMYESIGNDFREDNFPPNWNKKEMGLILSAADSQESLTEYLLEDDERWVTSCKRMTNLTSSSKVCLFGAGNIAAIMMRYLNGRSITPEFILDNNQKLWGQEWNGVRIIAPDKLAKGTRDRDHLNIIICSENYSDDMREQILGYGFEENCVIECNDMDSCVRVVCGK